MREPAHKRTKLLKIDFQCRSWNKEQGIEDLQAPVSCSCLSLPGETLLMCIFVCPPVVQCGAVRHCHVYLCNFGETTTEERHKVFFSGKEDKHGHGVGFLVHKDIVNTVMGCRPVSSRLITIRLRAVPFNIAVVQAHAPTSDYDDNENGRIL